MTEDKKDKKEKESNTFSKTELLGILTTALLLFSIIAFIAFSCSGGSNGGFNNQLPGSTDNKSCLKDCGCILLNSEKDKKLKNCKNPSCVQRGFCNCHCAEHGTN